MTNNTDNNKNKEVFEYGIKINPELDARFSEEGLKLLKKYYSENKGESAQKALAKAANNFSYGDKELAQRLTDYCSKGWFFFSSPPLSNAVEGYWDETVDYTSKEFWKPENKELRKAAWKGKTPKAMPISCFEGKTPIYCEDGVKNIEDIVEGDKVLTHKGRFKKVVATKRSSSSDIYEVRSMMNTTPLMVTGNHLLYTNYGWVRVDELEVGKHLLASSGVVSRDNDEEDLYLHLDLSMKSKKITNFVLKYPNQDCLIDKDLAWALGLWFAEGSVTDNGTVRVTNGELEVCQKWSKIMSEKLGLNYSAREAGEGYNWSNGSVHSKVLASNFNRLFGRGCKEKQIPKEWMLKKWKKEIFESFLEGFYLGDGFKTTNSKIFEITNVKLASQIALKCLEHNKRVSAQYRKYIHHNRSKNNGVYNAVVTFSYLKEKRASVRDGVIMPDGLFYSGVVSVLKQDVKNIHVYDIQVEDDESFSAAGIIAHNCFLTHLADNLESQLKASAEIKKLSVMGGGTSLQSRIRATSDKAPGPIPFIKTVDGDMGYWRQGKNRRGSCAVYMDVDHPDIVEFIKMRTPSGGDANRKILNRSGVHHGVNFTRKFVKALDNNEEYDLVCPHTKEVRERISAREVWELFLETRELTGEPYLWNIDNVNEVLPETQKELKLRNHGSNLCSEISLPNNDERTAVCCLSSLNLEMYDEWKDTNIVQDLVTFLDNILQWFIDYSDESLSRAAFSAEKERAIGIGGMGWANFLMKNNIPFESGGFNSASQWNNIIWKNIKDKAVEQSLALGSIRGEPDDMKGTGKRNSHLLAIAPNANSSILCNTSPSIEPLMSNAYTQKIRGSIMLVKNKYLEPILEKYGLNTKETWSKIVKSNGSVQWIEELSEEEKKVFKTAWEIDQHWLVQHAEDRQKYICQAQSLNLFFLPGTDRSYINSVHLKALRSPMLKSLYYFRTGSEGVSDNVKEAQRVSLKDWKDEGDGECVSCQS